MLEGFIFSVLVSLVLPWQIWCLQIHLISGVVFDFVVWFSPAPAGLPSPDSPTLVHHRFEGG